VCARIHSPRETRGRGLKTENLSAPACFGRPSRASCQQKSNRRQPCLPCGRERRAGEAVCCRRAWRLSSGAVPCPTTQGRSPMNAQHRAAEWLLPPGSASACRSSLSRSVFKSTHCLNQGLRPYQTSAFGTRLIARRGKDRMGFFCRVVFLREDNVINIISL
jgi:hypothetical protein